MTPVSVFEELRYVWELLAMEFVFLLPFARRRPHFRRNTLMGLLILSAASLGYFPIWSLGERLPYTLYYSIICGWYIALALFVMAPVLLCFRLTFCEALYFCISGYAAQHIVYVLVHELLALRLWTELPLHLPLYALISLCLCAVLLGVLYLVFEKQLHLCGGSLLSDTPRNILSHLTLLCILMICTFSCQYLFRCVDGVQGLAVQLGLLVCVLTLGLQYQTLVTVQSDRDRLVIERMLQNSAQHYQMAKEMVDHINRTCHDLKHNLQVLKTIDTTQRQAYIAEAERSIELYHELVHCDNEALNTILAEKCLFCQSRGIDLSCSVDDAGLDFISTPDLYALLGNAIDNAIECVAKFDDPGKRVIDLTISRTGGFYCIQTNNYYGKEPEMIDGLPATTKGDQQNHGFGLRSIRYLTKKYGGDMAVSAANHIFTLQIMLPVPK